MEQFSRKEINEMKELFITDTVDNLNTIEKEFLKIEKNPENLEPLVEVYRILHSLKGMAGTIGLVDYERFYHSFESVISLIQEKKIIITQTILDLLFNSMDVIETSIQKLQKNESYKEILNELFEKFIQIKNQFDFGAIDAEKKIRMKKLFEEYGLEDFTSQKININDKSKSFFLISITLDENVRLKIARVFVVIKNISNIGKIAYTNPNLYDLLEGRFNYNFKILIQCDTKKEIIKQIILDSGEIKNVDVDLIDTNQVKEIIEPKKKVIEEEKEEVISESGSDINAVKINMSDLDKLLEFLGELLIRSKQLEHSLGEIRKTNINEIVFQMQTYLFNLQDIILQIQMVPISIAFRVFPRLVRNLSQKLNKNIKINIIHHDVKIDRKLLQELSEILTHIIKNAIHHGIENESDRIKSNKSQQGTIRLESNVEHNVLSIEIEDDGKGIDVEKIKQYLLKKGLYSQEEIQKKTVENLINMIFEPNFSTSDDISEISGRGMGLNIVKQKVELLGGSITLTTHPGKGTCFRILLPLSRTLLRALLVRCNDQIYSIPLEDIQQLVAITEEDIKDIEGQKYLYVASLDKTIPIYDLNYLFDIHTKIKPKTSDKIKKLVQIKKGSKHFGLIVDDFVRESEIVIKKIESIANDVKGISGAAILEDGSVSLIIDSFSIVN